MSEEIREERKKLEEEYKESLKDFAIHYVAMWNALKSLGMSDKQIVASLRIIFEINDITLKKQMSKEEFDDFVGCLKEER